MGKKMIYKDPQTAEESRHDRIIENAPVKALARISEEIKNISDDIKNFTDLLDNIFKYGYNTIPVKRGIVTGHLFLKSKYLEIKI
jgi:hypothetical protein